MVIFTKYCIQNISPDSGVVAARHLGSPCVSLPKRANAALMQNTSTSVDPLLTSVKVIFFFVSFSISFTVFSASTMLSLFFINAVDSFLRALIAYSLYVL